MKHCAKCNIDYSDDVVFCSHCGNKLTEEHLSYTCPNCKQDLGSEYGQFCPHCGQQFDVKVDDSGSQTSNEEKSSDKAKSSNRNLIIAISIIAILVGGYFGFKQELINAGIVSPSTAEEHYNYSVHLQEKDDIEYLKHLREAADKGHMEASYRVGLMAQQFEKYADSFKYFSQAEAKGHKEATAHLGWHYDFGKGVEVDKNKAVMLYEKAANLGDMRAAYYAGSMYAEGYDVEVNLKKAIPLLEKVANSSSADLAADSQILLGQIYYQPFRKNIDIEKAIYWFTKAYESGKLTPIVYLGIIYKNDPVYKDYREAVKWHKIGAQKGIDVSMLWLSEAYYYGHGVVEDYDTHIYWAEKYKKAVHKLKDIVTEGL